MNDSAQKQKPGHVLQRRRGQRTGMTNREDRMKGWKFTASYCSVKDKTTGRKRWEEEENYTVKGTRIQLWVHCCPHRLQQLNQTSSIGLNSRVIWRLLHLVAAPPPPHLSLRRTHLSAGNQLDAGHAAVTSCLCTICTKSTSSSYKWP